MNATEIGLLTALVAVLAAWITSAVQARKYVDKESCKDCDTRRAKSEAKMEELFKDFKKEAMDWLRSLEEDVKRIARG